MAKSKVTATFKIGRSAAGYDSTYSPGSQELQNAIMSEVADQGSRALRIDPRVLQQKMNTILETELVNAIKYAANTLVGQGSGSNPIGGKTFNIQTATRGGSDVRFSSKDTGFKLASTNKFAKSAGIFWKRLSDATISRKYRTAKPNTYKFFMETGALQASLRAKARSFAKRTGVVQVQVKNNGKFGNIKGSTPDIVPFEEILIKFLPRLYQNDLPGLKGGDIGMTNPAMSFEQRIGVVKGSKDYYKLGGGKTAAGERVHRPLLQPVVTYWTLFRFPSQAAATLSTLFGANRKGAV